MIYFPIKGFLQNGGRECNEFRRVDLQKRSCSKGLCESKGTTTKPTTAPVPVNRGKERGKKNKIVTITKVFLLALFISSIKSIIVSQVQNKILACDPSYIC